MEKDTLNKILLAIMDVYNEDILVLQTCYYNPEGSFLIVAAKKVA